MKFCDKLIRLRKSRRMTQDEFAKIIGVSRQAVYKWECGQSYPEALKLVAIKELFGISIDDMLDDTFEVDTPSRSTGHRHRAAPAPAKEANREEEQVFRTPAQQEAAIALLQHTEQTLPEEPVKTEAENKPVLNQKEQSAPPEDQKKKSGFFSRLFGRK